MFASFFLDCEINNSNPTINKIPTIDKEKIFFVILNFSLLLEILFLNQKFLLDNVVYFSVSFLFILTIYMSLSIFKKEMKLSLNTTS